MTAMMQALVRRLAAPFTTPNPDAAEAHGHQPRQEGSRVATLATCWTATTEE
jgi:hypothetical protein